MRSPDAQKKELKEDALATIEEASKDQVIGVRRHVEVCNMSENNGAIEEMMSWVRSVRVFKRRVTKSVNQHTRNMMNASEVSNENPKKNQQTSGTLPLCSL